LAGTALAGTALVGSVQPHPDAGGDTDLSCRVHSVGGELHQYPPGVTTNRQGLLGVGILPEPGR
jgi:hypothetical protein